MTNGQHSPYTLDELKSSPEIRQQAQLYHQAQFYELRLLTHKRQPHKPCH